MAIDKQILKTRTISAIVFAVIMLFGYLVNHWTFIALNGLLTFFILKELMQLIGLINYKNSQFWVWIISTLGLVIYGGVVYFYQVVSKDPMNELAVPGENAMFKLMVYFGLFFSFFIMFLVLINGDFKKLFFPFQLLIGLFFISVSLCLLIPMYNWHIPILVLTSIWINDTMAYLVGSWIGKSPMAVSISPKKTWEGTIGGVLITILVAFLISFVYHGHQGFAELSRLNLIIIATISAIMGTIGDLLQSQLKRWAGVKDSGKMMPGHGGFYDRFDSFVFAISWVCSYLYFFY